METKFNVGDILTDKNTSTRYRIICIKSNQVVLCQMDCDTLNLYSHDIRVVVSLIETFAVEVTEETPRVYDVRMLAPPVKKRFDYCVGIIKKIEAAYGPDYLKLSSKSPKPELEKMHHDDKYGRYPQIVYLVVNCVANSNFSALYASIGNAIDRALGITTSVYQKLIESRRSLGEKAEKVRELVEIFAIGIIILDEIQLIDFQSTKENSFESLMTLTNRTKVAIAVVGTEDAYSKMFTHLRTARRLGNIISGNLYCENRTYFSILAKRVFKYQWFDSLVEMTNDMLEALYRNTHGIIDQLVGLCMYLNLDYISSKSRPTIDADYINKVAKRHYRGIQKLMDELDDPLNEKKRQKIIEEADRKLDNLLQEHKQTAFAEKIMESAEADEKKIPLKKNIIHNIEMVVADYTSDRIAAAVDRVLISTDETDEKVLTRVVMKLLTDSEKETPTKKKKSKKKPLQTSDMVKFIIE